MHHERADADSEGIGDQGWRAARDQECVSVYSGSKITTRGYMQGSTRRFGQGESETEETVRWSYITQSKDKIMQPPMATKDREKISVVTMDRLCVSLLDIL